MHAAKLHNYWGLASLVDHLVTAFSLILQYANTKAKALHMTRAADFLGMTKTHTSAF